MIEVKINWFWERLSSKINLCKFQRIYFDNLRCKHFDIVSYQNIYVGIYTDLFLNLISPKISLIIDNFSKTSLLFNLIQATKINILVSSKVKLTANFKINSSLSLYILADKTASINALFINILSKSDIRTTLKLRDRSRALIYSINVASHQAYFNVISALALGKNIKLKVIYDIVLMSCALLLVSPRFLVRNKHSLLVHAININYLSRQTYVDNRLIEPHLLTALVAYTLCTTPSD